MVNYFDQKTSRELVSHLLDTHELTSIKTISNQEWGRYPTAVVDVDDSLRYIQFQRKRDTGPGYPYQRVSGVVPPDYQAPNDIEYDYFDEESPDPNIEKDENMHGLFDDREGCISLHGDGPSRSYGLFKFIVTQGARGANEAHKVLGRTPGVNIPQFVIQPAPNNVHSAGQITESMADMRLPTLDGKNFYMVQHDLGSARSGHGVHGYYWPHIHPAYFRHISRLAQSTVETYGNVIHDEKGKRPKIVGDIAHSIDAMYFNLSDAVADITIKELMIRDGRLREINDTDIAESWVQSCIERAQNRHAFFANTLLLLPPELPQSERMKKGYWADMLLAGGIIDTRLALHETRPHPLADAESTQRTLRILGIIRKELYRRFSYVPRTFMLD